MEKGKLDKTGKDGIVTMSDYIKCDHVGNMADVDPDRTKMLREVFHEDAVASCDLQKLQACCVAQAGCFGPVHVKKCQKRRDAIEHCSIGCAGLAQCSKIVDQKKEVRLKLTLNVDYLKLSEDDKSKLTDKMRVTIATSAGVDQAAVSVQLHQGSVKVDAQIQASDASSADLCEKSIINSKMNSKIVEAASSIPGVKAAAVGDLKVEDFEVELTDPEQVPSGKALMPKVLQAQQSSTTEKPTTQKSLGRAHQLSSSCMLIASVVAALELMIWP